MAKNDFKAFATDRNANVISQEEWEALPALLSGFTAGKASSSQVNKVIRQASFIAAALAQFVSDKTQRDVLDNGDLPGFVELLGSGFAVEYLSRKNPFGDIKSDNTVNTALENLGLSDSAGFVGRLIGQPKIFTSSGTYTPTPGTKKILVEVQGAGSGGGGAGATSASSYSAGGNGTGGGYAMSLLDVAADNITSVPVTVGAGGLGGNGVPTGGNAGGASKFGSFITAEGGYGSLTVAPRDTAFTITGTYGGIATGGNIINRWGDGSDSVICIGGLIVIGRAGSSKFGGGANGYANWNVAGKNGTGYGSGGTGATSHNSPDAFYSGGNGADGIVIVWELA
ncbi:TPA: hypothetical protein N6818_001622 [Escherichia coli]|nr:hypothetical protein [Escherichia coli]